MDATMMIKILVFSAVFVAVSGITLDDCPIALPRDKYLQVHGNSCFRFAVNLRRDYFDAERDCERHRGTLALVKTFDVQDFLVKELSQTYGMSEVVWMGLDDADAENVFMWADGTKLNPEDYSNWAFDNGPRDDFIQHNWEDCVALNPTDGGQWHDYHCTTFLWSDHEFPFVCEYQVTDPSTTAAPQPPSSSPVTTQVPSSSSVTTQVTTSETTECPVFSCQLDCGMSGYMQDQATGCSLCQCDE